MEKYEILEKTIATYGKKMQLVVAMEEMSELIKELSKNIRGKDNVDAISEEMADVLIVVEQLMMIFENYSEVENWIDKKIARQKERLQKVYE